MSKQSLKIQKHLECVNEKLEHDIGNYILVAQEYR